MRFSIEQNGVLLALVKEYVSYKYIVRLDMVMHALLGKTGLDRQ